MYLKPQDWEREMYKGHGLKLSLHAIPLFVNVALCQIGSKTRNFICFQIVIFQLSQQTGTLNLVIVFRLLLLINNPQRTITPIWDIPRGTWEEEKTLKLVECKHACGIFPEVEVVWLHLEL